MSSNTKRILLPDVMARAGWDILRPRPDIEGVKYDSLIGPADLHALLADADAIALSGTPFGEAELQAGPRIAAVGRIGVGFDSVDVPALTRHGVPLLTAGIANSVSVAEAALFLMLALAKRGPALDMLVKSGRWHDRFIEPPVDLFGKTVLIIGFGRIGSRLATRCRAMEMRVVVYDPLLPPGQISEAGCQFAADLHVALPEADFLSVNCPRMPATINLIGAPQLALMKPTAYLVNTARGGIVDEAALYAALSEQRIAGAGLDVFFPEPPDPANPLLRLDRVIASPHMAGVTNEAMARMAIATVENLLSVLDGRPAMENTINPEVY
jgi:D-3-phosphoglycerate dehydrogenase